MVWGAVASVGLSMVLGFLWYSPFSLGKLWMKATFPGQTYTEIREGGNPAAWPLTMCSCSILVSVLHYFVGPYLGVTSVPAALKVGLALSVTDFLANFPHQLYNRASLVTYLIDHSYNAAVFTSSCLCLVYFS
ncbi:uncharacterized protein LOC117334571 [Pecten maximus]|uniref:uncharacterized protein LOC117334571 n=1 Tax=Pecten maximus TaxID=6579 RepID=UPI0014586AA5|nr:uncharacterized protein LOC117334571 [Pecten maximus]